MPSPEQEEPAILAMLRGLWEWRRILGLVSIVSFVLSVILAFVLPKTFTSKATLLPTDPPKADQLGAAAALLGKKGFGVMGDVDLYQSLLTSRSVLDRLLRVPIVVDTATLEKMAMWEFWKVDSADGAKMELAQQRIGKLVFVDAKLGGSVGIIEVRMDGPKSWMAKQLLEHLLRIGDEELMRARSKRHATILATLTQAVGAAKGDWDAATGAIASFRERNYTSNVPRVQLDLDRLLIDKQAKEQTYLLARRELDQEGLNHKKAGPPMVVLDAPNLPVRKSRPKRAVVILLGTLLPIIATAGGYLAWILLFTPAVPRSGDPTAPVPR